MFRSCFPSRTFLCPGTKRYTIYRYMFFVGHFFSMVCVCVFFLEMHRGWLVGWLVCCWLACFLLLLQVETVKGLLMKQEESNDGVYLYMIF